MIGERGGIRRFAHRLARRVDRLLHPGGRGLVLLYHRVADEPSDPYGLCVTPSEFEEHLRIVCGLGAPMALPAMVEALRDGALPDRAIGVTFDDAYLDVHDVAVPLLRDHGVPATVFVTTGPAGRDREFWWDELERVLLEPERLPDTLEIELGGRTRMWELGSDAVYDGTRRRECRTWRLYDEVAPTARHAAFREVYDLLRPMPESARTPIMDRLVAWAGMDGVPMRPSRKVMSPDQVARMAADGLMAVGAHTVTHPDLPAQTREVQAVEARRSKEVLESWIGGRVDGFAYPYGFYDEATVSAVGEAGFTYACSVDHEAVRGGERMLLIPRVDALAGGRDGLAGLVRDHLG